MGGEWAECLFELDTDFGTVLDWLDELGVADNTIVVFSGDNGAEEMEPWRGDPGTFSGSYFTGMEGSLRTPCMVRYPGVVPAGRTSNEIVHITDQFTTLLGWAGAEVPTDRVIDGMDQRAFWEGADEHSARAGFPYWNSNVLYGVKWGNFKVAMMEQMYLTSPAMTLPTSHIINLVVDPKERKALDYPYVHSWVGTHAYEVLAAFKESVAKEPLIPLGAPLDFVPHASRRDAMTGARSMATRSALRRASYSGRVVHTYQEKSYEARAVSAGDRHRRGWRRSRPAGPARCAAAFPAGDGTASCGRSAGRPLVGVRLLAIGVASGMARDDRGGAAVRGVLGASWCTTLAPWRSSSTRQSGSDCRGHSCGRRWRCTRSSPSGARWPQRRDGAGNRS